MSENNRGSKIPESLNVKNYSSVVDVFNRTCNEYADNMAFNSFGHGISFKELDQLADAFACYLQRETGLKKGDRIAIQLPNILQHPITVFGAMRAGLIVVNTNPLYTPRELLHQFNDAEVKALVVYEGVAFNVAEIIDQTAIEVVLVTGLADFHNFFSRLLINNVVKYVKKMIPDYHLPKSRSLRQAVMGHLHQEPTPVEIKASDIAVLQYTGGTTGVAKGVILTQGNLVSNMLQGAAAISEAKAHWNEALIAPLPLYHIYAFTISLIIMESGGLSVLIANPRDFPAFVKELKKWRFSGFLGLNTLFVALCNQESFKALDFSNLKVTISGGMALTHDSAELWQQITGCEIMEGYGLSEASPIVAANPIKDIHVGTIGLPLRETTVKLIKDNEEEVCEGESGEICVKGPQVMRGYWKQDKLTTQAFTTDGYLKTGDVAIVRENGRLSIVDRASDLIVVSGFNVYPSEIEDVISSHPDVLECAAIGVKNSDQSESIRLFAVLSASSSVSAEEISQWSRQYLTSYKVPKDIHFVTSLPKSNVGKVLRRMLRSDTES